FLHCSPVRLPFCLICSSSFLWTSDRQAGLTESKQFFVLWRSRLRLQAGRYRIAIEFGLQTEYKSFQTECNLFQACSICLVALLAQHTASLPPPSWYIAARGILQDGGLSLVKQLKSRHNKTPSMRDIAA